MEPLIFVLLAVTALSTRVYGDDASKKLDLSPSWHHIEMGDQKVVETKEDDVDIDGIRYHRIQFQGQYFYVKFLASKNDQVEDEVLCSTSGARVVDPPRLAEAAVQTSKRTRVFIEGLIRRCNDNGYGTHVSLDPAPRAGISILPKDKDGGEKRIFYNPLANSLGFSSEW